MGNAVQVELEVERLGVANSPKLVSATEQELVAFETAFGHQLPADYRWFLSNFGRSDKRVDVRVPIKTETEYVSGRLETLYEFTAVSDLYIDKEPSWLLAYGIVVDLDVNAAEPYFTKLVLISELRHDVVWALDYRYDPVNPPVVVIDYVSSGARDMHTNALDVDWLSYVAPSFTAMLQQAPTNSGTSDTEMTTYQHSDLALDWEASTAAYFEEQCGPLTPRSHMKTQRD